MLHIIKSIGMKKKNIIAHNIAGIMKKKVQLFWREIFQRFIEKL